MQSLHGRQDERVLHELKEWQNSFIDVQTLMDSLAVSRGRVRDLQEKVCNLLHAGKRYYAYAGLFTTQLEQTQCFLHEANLDREELYTRAKKVGSIIMLAPSADYNATH